MGPPSALSWCWHSGTFSIAAAAFVFSLATLCAKLLGLHGRVPVLQVTASSSLFCLLGTSALVWACGDRLHPGSSRGLYLTLVRGALGAVALVFLYLAMNWLPMKDAVTLFFTSPVIAALLEHALVPEYALSAASFAGCSVAVIGAFLVSQPDRLHLPGALLATTAAAANAGAFVTVRILGPTPSAAVLTWWYHLIVLGTSLLPLLAQYPAGPTLPDRSDGLLLLATSVAQLLGQVLLSRGLQLESATRGSAINVLQVPLAFAWDLLVLHNDTNTLSALGACLVVAGILAVTASTAAHAKTVQPGATPAQPEPDAAQQLELAPLRGDAWAEPVKLVHVAVVAAEQEAEQECPQWCPGNGWSPAHTPGAGGPQGGG